MVDAHIKKTGSDGEVIYRLFKAFLYFFSEKVSEKMGQVPVCCSKHFAVVKGYVAPAIVFIDKPSGNALNIFFNDTAGDVLQIMVDLHLLWRTMVRPDKGKIAVYYFF